MSETLELRTIGVIRSPWPEKFGIPRQSGLAEGVEARVELDRDRVPAEALRGIEAVSHLWLITWFHAVADEGWRPTVRPPRLGGSTRLGVFATRAPHRPNPLGLSLVRLVAVEDRCLRVRGADLLDATPVLDIKPYLPWAEARSDARCDWAPTPPLPLEVEFSAAAELALTEAGPELRALIVDSLRWDPRPAHQRGQERSYGVALGEHEVRFRVLSDAQGPPRLLVEAIESRTAR